MEAALWIGAIVAALFGIDQLALWAERKGWLYWRKSKRRSGVLSGVLSGLEPFANPHAVQVEKAKDEKTLEERDSGDPPSITS